MILGVEQPWCEADTLLSMALTLDEKARCPGCGQYMDEAHDPDNDGAFEVEEAVCYACAAQERWRRDHEKNRPEAGTLTYLRKLVARRPRKRQRRDSIDR